MKTIFLTTVAFAAAALAQVNIPGLPKCAGSCVSTDFGGCGQLNVNCICANKPLIANLACCVGHACTPDEQAATLKFANALCAGNGVSDLPQSATCAPGAASTLVSGTTNFAGSATTATTAPTGGSTSSSGSASVTVTSASTTSSSGTTRTTSSSSGTAAGATTSPTGSGNRLEAAAFGLGAVAFGALAAI